MRNLARVLAALVAVSCSRAYAGDAPPAPSPSAGTAQEQWDHRYLGFEDWVAYDVRSGVVVNSWSKPVEGKYRRPLSYEEFYGKVGRADLAERYHHRRNVKIFFGVLGGLAVVGGLAAFIGQAAANINATSDCIHGGGFGSSSSCDDTGIGGYVAGGVLMGVGTITIIGAIAAKSQPTQPYETREMADQYNKKLRDELGLDRPAAAPAQQPAPAPTVDTTTVMLSPSVGPKSVSLTLAARF